jgi:hypothetical protein
MSRAKAIVLESPQQAAASAGWCSEDLERKARYFSICNRKIFARIVFIIFMLLGKKVIFTI